MSLDAAALIAQLSAVRHGVNGDDVIAACSELVAAIVAATTTTSVSGASLSRHFADVFCGMGGVSTLCVGVRRWYDGALRHRSVAPSGKATTERSMRQLLSALQAVVEAAGAVFELLTLARIPLEPRSAPLGRTAPRASPPRVPNMPSDAAEKARDAVGDYDARSLADDVTTAFTLTLTLLDDVSGRVGVFSGASVSSIPFGLRIAVLRCVTAACGLMPTCAAALAGSASDGGFRPADVPTLYARVRYLATTMAVVTAMSVTVALPGGFAFPPAPDGALPPVHAATVKEVGVGITTALLMGVPFAKAAAAACITTLLLNGVVGARGGLTDLDRAVLGDGGGSASAIEARLLPLSLPCLLPACARPAMRRSMQSLGGTLAGSGVIDVLLRCVFDGHAALQTVAIEALTDLLLLSDDACAVLSQRRGIASDALSLSSQHGNFTMTVLWKLGEVALAAVPEATAASSPVKVLGAAAAAGATMHSPQHTPTVAVLTKSMGVLHSAAAAGCVPAFGALSVCAALNPRGFLDSTRALSVVVTSLTPWGVDTSAPLSPTSSPRSHRAVSLVQLGALATVARLVVHGDVGVCGALVAGGVHAVVTEVLAAAAAFRHDDATNGVVAGRAVHYTCVILRALMGSGDACFDAARGRRPRARFAHIEIADEVAVAVLALLADVCAKPRCTADFICSGGLSLLCHFQVSV